MNIREEKLPKLKKKLEVPKSTLLQQKLDWY